MATNLLNRDQAADHLSISVQTLDRLVRAGDITPLRIGSRGVRFTTAALDAYLDRCAAPDPEARLKGLADLIPSLTLAQRTDLAVQLLRGP